jgi:glycogen debranching enzyme
LPLHRAWETRLARARCDRDAFRAGCARPRCDDAVLQRALDRSLEDVYALRVHHGGRGIVGAGIPWFAAPFGRDALVTAAQLLPVAPELAAESLRFLAHHQGREEVPAREEQPGRILHELRRGEMVRAGEIPHAPYFGSIDATPLFVVVAEELWRWTADPLLLEALWPSVEAALGWLDRATDEGRTFLRYQRTTPLGLENQGWKDSRDGVSFPDGRRARAPIALVEVQGYAAAAWRAGAELAHARGDHARAEAWTARVGPFLAALDTAFWLPRQGWYALALDGEDRPVPTLTSNPGHLLWARAALPARVDRLRHALLSPELWSGWGIRTVGRGQGVFNPLSYHNGSVWPHDGALCALGMARHGHTRDAVRVAEGLFAASEHFAHHRLPELFCGMERGEGELLVHYPVSCSPQAWAAGAPFMLLQACLGLEADALAGVLQVRDPVLPARLRRLDLLGVRVGDSRVSLRFTRAGLRTWAEVLERSGAPLRVNIAVGGP